MREALARLAEEGLVVRSAAPRRARRGAVAADARGDLERARRARAVRLPPRARALDAGCPRRAQPARAPDDVGRRARHDEDRVRAGRALPRDALAACRSRAAAGGRGRACAGASRASCAQPTQRSRRRSCASTRSRTSSWSRCSRRATRPPSQPPCAATSSWAQQRVARAEGIGALTLRGSNRSARSGDTAGSRQRSTCGRSTPDAGAPAPATTRSGGNEWMSCSHRR